MSIYETSITNPKKQLEFYKQLSEQLQQENEKLKADYGTKVQVERDLLKEENKILKENSENNDKVVDKVNWENQLLKKENEQLKDNWNKLKEWLEEEIKHLEKSRYVSFNEYGENKLRISKEFLFKMQEIEKGGMNE